MENIDDINTETDYTDNTHVPASPLDNGPSLDDANYVIMHDQQAPDVHEDASTPDEIGAMLVSQNVPPAGWHPSSYS